jgi:hypothetical protein
MGAEGDIKRDRIAVFQPEFIEDLEYWVDNDRKMALPKQSYIICEKSWCPETRFLGETGFLNFHE